MCQWNPILLPPCLFQEGVVGVILWVLSYILEEQDHMLSLHSGTIWIKFLGKCLIIWDLADSVLIMWTLNLALVFSLCLSIYFFLQNFGFHNWFSKVLFSCYNYKGHSFLGSYTCYVGIWLIYWPSIIFFA